MNEIRKQIVPMDALRYSAYLRMLERVSATLLKYYDTVDEHASRAERESMILYAQKFLETIRSLRLRYIHSPMYRIRPGIDLTVSGFPHYYDINQLTADLSQRQERLPKLASMDNLKAMLLEHTMTAAGKVELEGAAHDTEQNLLWQISERAYLEGLDLRKQFYQFTPGKLLALPDGEFEDQGRRAYSFSWGCYDSETNRPYVYFMIITQDRSAPPLTETSPDYVKFLDTIQHIAARAPANLSAIAIRLDESFRTLYPKALKRICVGPLISPRIFAGQEVPPPETLAGRMLPIFERAEVAEDDFVIFFDTEYAFSSHEEVVQRLLPFGENKPRQIFHVPKNDQRLLKRGSATIVSHAIMPHRLRQQLSTVDPSIMPELSGVELFIYEPQGEIIRVG